ncbi:ABC-three component system protein [Micromonospora tulbaghiae]|uniref:ABC-three component system protein n=1 Tax=Micromonospora tulbaghiae TaxID=479978 RepID=UPI0033CAFF15
MVDKADTEGLFEASASAVGYVYQLRKALHSCVERHGRGLEWSIAIEAGDDIEEVDQDGRVLQQLKHRAPGIKMTDSSADLWKTLRIWSHAVAHHRIDLDETDLLLLTTADLPVGSVGYLLQPAASGVRDEEGALRALVAARMASSSKDNKKAYEAFDKLSDEQRRAMLARVQVLGNAPNVDAVEGLLLERVVLAVGHQYARPFLQRLEGWFYQRTIRQLRSDEVDAITGSEFDQIFTDLRNQFRPENLPIDDDIAVLEPDPTDCGDMIFVRQLHLIELGSTQVGIAVRDYIRAYTQRSRWSDDNLLLPGEIGQYERRLVEEWRDHFAEMEDDLGPTAAEAQKVEMAKIVYRWATREARRRIRPDCDEPFVSKGSYHILADDLRIGWHVDFIARLMAILEPVEAPARD